MVFLFSPVVTLDHWFHAENQIKSIVFSGHSTLHQDEKENKVPEKKCATTITKNHFTSRRISYFNTSWKYTWQLKPLAYSHLCIILTLKNQSRTFLEIYFSRIILLIFSYVLIIVVPLTIASCKSYLLLSINLFTED